MDTHSVSLCNNKDMTNSFCELTNYTELDISVGANHVKINIQVEQTIIHVRAFWVYKSSCKYFSNYS